jgi:hypothetical protein
MSQVRSGEANKAIRRGPGMTAVGVLLGSLAIRMLKVSMARVISLRITRLGLYVSAIF